MPNGGREIVESTRFASERDAIMGDVRRWDEIFFGIDWALCLDPEEAGQTTSAPGIWAVPIVLPAGEPDLLVYYTFNDERVTLMSIRRVESKGEA